MFWVSKEPLGTDIKPLQLSSNYRPLVLPPWQQVDTIPKNMMVKLDLGRSIRVRA